jgi:catechol 2,3-dioxygenase-like lactoylglutathione lyase family enzyme
MLKLTHVNVWVHDQDEALAFYTEKLGMELRDDVTVPEMGNFRWLTVGPVGQPDVALALMTVPGPPVFDAETSQQVKAIVAKGAAGGLFFSTEDCRAEFEDLKSRGVEFAEEPTDRPYGVDAGFRDLSGNHFRMIQS